MVLNEKFWEELATGIGAVCTEKHTRQGDLMFSK
jgi:hypothetical protein